MRTVFNNHMVAHVWAQQSQEYGRSNNGQFYFRGPTIYSYRDSWPVATFVKNDAGESAVLVNNDHYSVTTSAHTSYVRRAIRVGIPTFLVAHLVRSDRNQIDHERNRADYQARLDDAMRKVARARANIVWREDTAMTLAREMNAYAAFFGLDWSVAIPSFDDASMSVIKAQARAESAEARRRAKEKRERIESRSDGRMARVL